jgi:hypothetical protein
VLVASGLCIAALVIVAGGAVDRLRPAPETRGQAEALEIEAVSPPGVTSRVHRVAAEAIVSALRASPLVANVRAARAADATTRIRVRLASADEAERSIGQLESEIDPGPLGLRFAATPLVLAAARDSVQGQLGELELLVAPLVLATLALAAGLRAGALIAVGALAGLSGALVALRVADGYLVAFVPAAAIGLAHAVELGCLLGALDREEPLLAHEDRMTPILSRWRGPALASTAVRALVPAVLLATPFDDAWAISLASAVAVVLTTTAIWLLARYFVGAGSWRSGPARAESRISRAVPAAAGRIARSTPVLVGVLVVAIALPLALAVPGHETRIARLSASDLPADVRAGEPAPANGNTGGGDDLPQLLIAAALLASVVGLAFRDGHARRFAGLLTVLPAAATLGLLVLVVQRGDLAVGIVDPRQLLVGGVVAAALAAVAAIAAGRAALAAALARETAGTAIGHVGGAELTGRLTLPGAAASTVIVAAAFGTLAGADLQAARVLGLAIAIGCLLDLVFARIPLLAALARWGQ